MVDEFRKLDWAGLVEQVFKEGGPVRTRSNPRVWSLEDGRLLLEQCVGKEALLDAVDLCLSGQASNWEYSEVISMMLRVLRSRKTTEYLGDLFRDEQRPEVKTNIAQLLKDVGGEYGLKYIEEMLKSEITDVRRLGAYYAFDWLETVEDIPGLLSKVLERLDGDDDTEIRRVAKQIRDQLSRSLSGQDVEKA